MEQTAGQVKLVRLFIGRKINFVYSVLADPGVLGAVVINIFGVIPVNLRVCWADEDDQATAELFLKKATK